MRGRAIGKDWCDGGVLQRDFQNEDFTRRKVAVKVLRDRPLVKPLACSGTAPSNGHPFHFYVTE